MKVGNGIECQYILTETIGIEYHITVIEININYQIVLQNMGYRISVYWYRKNSIGILVPKIVVSTISGPVSKLSLSESRSRFRFAIRYSNRVSVSVI